MKNSMWKILDPFKPIVAFHIETSHLISKGNQMRGFYMESSTGRKWVKVNNDGP